MTKPDPDAVPPTETRTRRSFLAVTGALGATLLGIPASATARLVDANRISVDEAVGYARGRVNRFADDAVGSNAGTTDEAVNAVAAFGTANSDSIVEYLTEHVPITIDKREYAAWQVGFLDGETRTTRYLVTDVVDDRDRSIEFTEIEPPAIDHAVTRHNEQASSRTHRHSSKRSTRST